MSHESTRSVSRREFLIGSGATGAVALAGCTSAGNSTENGSSLSGQITITGSSTVYPLATAISKKFKKKHSGVDFSVSPTGSGGGFQNHFCLGKSDFNNASRQITDGEKQLCEKNGVDYHEINVATDALTVIVNNENDWVDCMTPEQLSQIWGPGAGSDQTWSDIDSSWPDKKINRFGAAETSGTFDYFSEVINGEVGKHTQAYEPTEKDNIILQGVQQDEYAIGYFGFAYYSGNKDAVKALKINNGDGCVAPTLQNAKSGAYKPLARPLFTYPSMDALSEDHVAEFARFFVKQSANSKLVADRVGYVPKTEETMQKELDALNKAIEKANA